MHEFAVFCDDIRMEANGKFLLIGVYGDAMIIGAMPFNGRLACMLRLDSRHLDKQTLRMRLESGAVLGQIEVEIENVTGMPSDTMQVALPPLPLNLSRPDEVIIERVRGDGHDEIGRLKIMLGEIPQRNTPNALQS